MQRIVTFKISQELLEMLDLYAREKGMSRSEAIREAIKMLLTSSGMKLPTSRVTVPDTRAQVFEIIV